MHVVRKMLRASQEAGRRNWRAEEVLARTDYCGCQWAGLSRFILRYSRQECMLIKDGSILIL